MEILNPIAVLLFICLLAYQSCRSVALVRHDAKTIRNRTNYTLVTVSKDTGAACLDGSHYVFPIWPDNPNRWTIWILGGGSCYDAKTCENRTRTNQGSSLYPLPKAAQTCKCMNYGPKGNELGCTCVILPYCDGGFFAGHLPGSYITSTGAELKIRGHRNLDASLDVLKSQYGLANGSELVFTGSSSGGVAAIMHLDSVAHQMPSSMKVFGVPKAGFTLDHKSKNDNNGYMDLLSWQFHMHHMIDAISKDCLAAYSDEPWKCMVASHAARFVKTPMFLLNSKYDAWQMTTILGLGRNAIYEEGAGTRELLQAVTEYGNHFMNQLRGFMNASESCSSCSHHHAAFLTSCICHVECAFAEQTIGDTLVSELLGRWMSGEIDSKPAVYVDERPPNYDCDPSGSNSVM